VPPAWAATLRVLCVYFYQELQDTAAFLIQHCSQLSTLVVEALAGDPWINQSQVAPVPEQFWDLLPKLPALESLDVSCAVVTPEVCWWVPGARLGPVATSTCLFSTNE
jgi:hypothetical protein